MAKTMSDMEKMILSKDFIYEPPYFYNNKLALRCELGIGNCTKDYLKNAKKRAGIIFNILFKNGVDMFFFDNYYDDYDFDMGETAIINNIISVEKRRLQFSLGYQQKFEHRVVRDIPFDKENDNNFGIIRVNRICCYPNEKFNAIDIINSQIKGKNELTIHLVSFENNCIFTVYDDRGCDIVFYDKSRFQQFYPLLEEYFLDYDIELMKRRLEESI